MLTSDLTLTVWQALLYSLMPAVLVCVLAWVLHNRHKRAAQQRYQQLEERMTERAEELEAARKKAIDIAEAKTLFMANMSHEIRTPMNAIIGLAHLVQHTDLSDRQKDYIKKIERSGHHLLGVLNDILDFSKVESGMLAIESIAFELDTLLQEVATMVGPTAYDKGLEFICVAAPDVPRHLVGDPLRLTQVLVNFLYHAVKQTSHGEVTLHVERCGMAQAPHSQTGVGLRFTVQDSGEGLSQHQCEHLFEGYPLQNVVVQRQQGARGLGLPVGKRLVELMGGEVGVTGLAKRGTTLWFTTWLQEDAHPEPQPLPERSVEGLKALVVDDHPIAAQTIAELLRRLGLRVDSCHSGRDGLERIRQSERNGDPYGVVLLDWEMPDWDGLQSARNITAAGLAQTPGIIVVTGHSRDEIAKPAMAAGLSDILIKPVTASTLFEMLMRVVRTVDARSNYGRKGASVPFVGLESVRGAQILLVEDDEINQEVACEMLRMAGMEVDLATDGRMAMDRVAHKRYDLVLMDMQMPVMDGVMATRNLRSDPRHADLPIVAMTANTMQSDRDRCLAAGMNGFIAKPIEPKQLESVLRQWIAPMRRTEDAYK
jgi:two-component system sensor histidine kinase/response regulator